MRDAKDDPTGRRQVRKHMGRWRVSTVKGRCPSTYNSVPAPGEVGPGPDYKATCSVCGKRVSITKRGLYWPHLRGDRAEAESK
jgi:hypothetical protein